MALYPYNKTLNSLQSFQVYTSYVNAVPRFVILLDDNSDCQTDVVLLSDYQFTSNGTWRITQGGLRWGWTTASPDLSAYGQTWNDLSYWKGVYGNATVLYVGVALEYWAVKDSNGLGQPLFADELVLNGATYGVAGGSSQPPSGSTLDDWSMYRHDVQRSGLSASSAPNCRLLWQYFTGPSPTSSLADRLRASPAVVGGVVYVGSNSSSFYALNATTGSPIWQVDVGANVESSAAVVDNVVYVGILWNGHNGYVDALNATDGSVIWRFATNSGIESSPAVVDGVVYVGSYNGYVYALNAASGALKWSFLTGGSTFSSPAVVGGIVYIGSIDGRVYALNATNGALIWSFQTSDPVYASPALSNGVVYVNSDNGTVYALRANDGSKIWQATIGMGDHADDSPAVSAGILYIGARNGYYAFNATDGKQIWFFTSPYSPRQTTGYIYSSPAVAGNIVYFGSFDSYLFVLNAFNGAMIWSYQTGGFLFSSPAISNGVVYIGSYDGNIYAIGDPTQPSPVATDDPQPTATPAPAPTPQPTATPTSNSTTQPAPTVNAQAASTHVSITSQTPTLAATAQPNLTVAPSQDETVNWIILAGVVIVLMSFLALLLLVLAKKPS